MIWVITHPSGLIEKDNQGVYLFIFFFKKEAGWWWASREMSSTKKTESEFPRLSKYYCNMRHTGVAHGVKAEGLLASQPSLRLNYLFGLRVLIIHLGQCFLMEDGSRPHAPGQLPSSGDIFLLSWVG